MSQVPVTPGQSQVPANMSDYQFANTGLEDFAVSDAVLPRIKIDHDNAMWVDNLSGLQLQVLRFIPLGLIKQRTLFHHIVDNNDVPMCKSTDFQIGYPNPEAPSNKSFPWQLAGFDPANFPPDAEGNTKLPCANCKLKEWGSSPNSENPYCSEQWTLPIYYDTSGNYDWAPAILTFQKSQIKAIRSYLTPFHNANRPPFLQIAQATLKQQQRGSVMYCVPSFSQIGETDRSQWMSYSEQYVEMRNYLTRPPLRGDDGAAAGQAQQPASNVNDPSQYAQPMQQQQQTYQQPAAQQMPQAPAPQQSNDPWAVQPPQPAQNDPWAPQQTQAPAPQQMQQPVAPQAPAPQQMQQPMPPQPVAPQAPAPQQMQPPVEQPIPQQAPVAQAPQAPQPPAPPAPQPPVAPQPPAPEQPASQQVIQGQAEQQQTQQTPPAGQGLPF